MFRLPLEILGNEESTFFNAVFIIECLSLYRLLLLRTEDWVPFLYVVSYFLCYVLLGIFCRTCCVLASSEVLLVVFHGTCCLYLLSDGRSEYEIQDK